MMRITHNNYSGNITEQQAIHSREYLKLFTEDSVLKKVEKYIDNQIYCIAFYELGQESISAILKDIYEGYESRVEIIQTEKYLDYSIENSIIYNNPSFDFIQSKFRILFNKDKQTICYQKYDVEKDILDLGEAMKYYVYGDDYDPDYDLSEKRFMAYYNSDGSFHFAEHLWLSDYDREEYHANELDRFKREMGLSDQEYQYYLTAEFLPQ